MKSKLFLILLFSSLLALHGCDKIDDDTPTELTLADFLNNNKPALQTFTVTAGQVSQIQGAKGCTINFNANSFVTLSGTTVTSGDVVVKLREVTTKKDMVLSQTPTISDGELIVSQGVYYLEATQNGSGLQVSNFQITKTWSPYPVGENVDAFLGGLNGDNRFEWFNTFANVGPPMSIGSVNDSTITDSLNPAPYEMSLITTFLDQNYNWINCDYFYTSPAPKVAVFFPTADSINGYLFQSYLVFNDLNAVLRYDHYTNQTLEFYNIPSGLDATLVTYYITNGKAFVATANITVSDALSTPVTFTETTEQGLLDILGGL